MSEKEKLLTYDWKQNLFRIKVSASGKSELRYVNVGLEIIEF